MRPEWISKIRDFLNLEKIKHEDAKTGSIFLRELSDNEIFAIFYALTERKYSPGEVASVLMSKHKEASVKEPELQAALRRLSMLGLHFAKEIFSEKTPEAVPERPVVDILFNPGSTLHDHVEMAARADRAMDAVGGMASLAVLLEEQLKNLDADKSRVKSPFLYGNHVNQAAAL
jgi:hypothetical protein